MSHLSSDIASARFLREGEEEKLLEFLISAFGRWPSHEIAVPAIDHLRWKLRSHQKAIGWHIVAELGSQIVGARLSLVRVVKVKERTLLARQGADLAAHPDHRRTGITKRMQAFHQRELEDEFDLGIGITGHAAMVKLDTRAGFRPFANHIQALQCKIPRPTRQSALPMRTSEPWTITTLRKFDQRVDSFWVDASKPFDFIVARTKDYLNWRYCDIRSGTSLVLLAEQDELILGYAALRVSVGRGYIADLLCLPGRLDVVDSLVSEALDHFVDAGALNAEWWLPSHHPYVDLAGGRGFATKRPMPLTYRPLRTPYKDLAFLDDPSAAVHLAAGDADIV